MYEHGEQQISDEELAKNVIVGSDLDEHASRIRELEQLGATVIVLQNNSGADPLGAIRAYGEHVLPALRGVRV
jgi:coenzyme F420-dependent glucose-6-phosphate dehydrogenase